jgi:Rho GDP-dissociation inhibitor
LEPEVKFLSLAIKSGDRDDMIPPVPETGNPDGLWFTLKEGSRYRLMFTFQVNHNIVSGLKYTNTVWKTGIKGKYIGLLLIFSDDDDINNNNNLIIAEVCYS